MATIRFSATAVIEQEIQCMEGLYAQDIIAGLKSGAYATTLAHEEGEETPYIIDVVTNEPVAFIVSQSVAKNGPSEYFDFEETGEDE